MVGGKLASSRRARSMFVSSMAAFTLLAAPTVRAIQVVCDQCPPTCPMHNPANAKHAKPSCHNQGSMRMHPGHHAKRARGPEGHAVSRPPCSHSGAIPGVAMGPMVLADRPSARFYLPAEEFWQIQQRLRIRFNEPPQLPPPILVS